MDLGSNAAMIHRKNEGDAQGERILAVRLFGGLGNQMFQYALGRSVALRSDLSLHLEVTGGFVDDFYKRRYALANFMLDAKIIAPEQVPQRLFKSNSAKGLGKVISWFDNRLPHVNYGLSRLGWQIIHEREGIFNENVFLAGPKSYLVGYWQCEAYFRDIRQILLRDFELRSQIPASNSRIVDEMRSTNSVAVHYRRLHGISGGVTKPAHYTVHGQLDRTYYESAIRFIAERESNLRVFVFSDDAEWARSNVLLSHPHQIVDVNDDESSFLDLWLMSQCRHNVVANSTFSWWSAWLNANATKVVTVPRRWYTTESLSADGILPVGWHAM